MSINIARNALEIKNTVSSIRHKPEYSTLVKFASAEHLAHIVPYELCEEFDNTIPLVILDSDGVVREYMAKKIEAADPGIVGFILIGKDPTNTRVHVTFRGTHDGASIVRDLEQGAAGQASFAAEGLFIASQITNAVSKVAATSGKKVNLTISGHSLGGADAQNCAAIMMKEMVATYSNIQQRSTALPPVNFVEKRKMELVMNARAPLTMIESITINHVNSAGVTQNTAAHCKHNAKVLSRLGVKIGVRALKVAGDSLEQTGQTNILADSFPEHAHVEVLRINKGYNGWTAFRDLLITIAGFVAGFFGVKHVDRVLKGAANVHQTYLSHTSMHFDKQLADTEFEYANNLTVDGSLKVKNQLEDKIDHEDDVMTSGVKKALHTVSKRFVKRREVAPTVGFGLYREASARDSVDLELGLGTGYIVSVF